MTLARIVSRTEMPVSSWVSLVSKEVEFDARMPPETYHCLSLPDYIAILACTRGGLIPIVQQYRPAVDACAWELPAGLLERDEDPEDACRRELKEETGLDAESVIYLGSYYPDTGRLENRLHAFFVHTADPDPAFVPEPRTSVQFVTGEILRGQIMSGEFRNQLHLGVLGIASLRGLDWTRRCDSSSPNIPIGG